MEGDSGTTTSTGSGSGWSSFSSIASGLGNLVGGISNAYAAYQTGKNQGEYLSYQKDLQKKIFEREDTALQRRMSDAKAAGLNPFSVANGNGAGAGQVVNVQPLQAPNYGDFGLSGLSENYGKYIDTLNAIEANYQMQTQSKTLKHQEQIANIERLQARRQNQIEQVQNWLDKGISPSQIWYNSDHDSYGYTNDSDFTLGKDDIPLTSTPLWKRYQWSLQNDKAMTDSLAYRSLSDYYTMMSDKWHNDTMKFDTYFNRVLRGVDTAAGLLHGGSHAVDAINSFRDVEGRNRLRESQIEVNNYKNQPTRTTKSRIYSNGSGYTERSFSTK